MRNEVSVSKSSFTDKKIISGSVLLVQSLDGNELQYDTMDAVLDLGSTVPTLFKPKGADGLLTTENELYGVRPLIQILVADPTLYKYGEEVIYKHDGVLVGKYYMTSIKKVGKTKYRISCVSPIGLLVNSQHYGGIYSGIKFSDLVAEIIGGVVPFSVAPELENQPVYGWLSISTRRENLHQALFAMGAAAQKDENGDLVFKPLSDETHTEIPESRIYTSGSVSYPEAVTKVSISEHTFLANDTDETVVLFDGLVAAERITTPSGVVAEGTVVLFNEPVHDLVVENGTIIESSVNYAVLAPSSQCKLTGQKYSHMIRQVTRPETAEGGDTETENKITVTDATLVSIANSENVADRLMSYYSSAKTISTDIVVGSERAGSAVQLADPFGDATTGIITSMGITMSNTLKAHTEVVADYRPGGAGNFYKNFDVISSDSSWTVPEGVSRIRVAIIGGGTGGSSGTNGEAGARGESSPSGTYAYFSGENGAGGKGGSKGAGGNGGRILVETIAVEEGQTFDIAIGQGGSGGVCTGAESNPGTQGGNTTFGSYSSENGTVSSYGYTDLFEGGLYGARGKDGTNGSDGDGGGTSSGPATTGASITIAGVTYSSGQQGEGDHGVSCYGYGGLGGGAAAGSNGGDGEAGDTMVTQSYGVYYYLAFGGTGGKGATAVSPDNAENFGCGGNGGHGGGGGGGGGSGYAADSVSGASGGAGGSGSNGSSGASGCVLIYY